MDFKIGVEETYGCVGFRGELHIHIISHMMRVVATDGMIDRIANIRHGIWKMNGGPLLRSGQEILSIYVTKSTNVMCTCMTYPKRDASHKIKVLL